MTKSNGVRQLVGVTDATLTEVLFFIIIGVFGLQFAIAGLRPTVSSPKGRNHDT